MTVLASEGGGVLKNEIKTWIYPQLEFAWRRPQLVVFRRFCHFVFELFLSSRRDRHVMLAPLFILR